MMTAITRSELLDFVGGLGVSERQLKRWRKHGLLPTPELRSQGRARGMIAYYPAETRQQVVDLVYFKERHRRLDVVGWLLWSQGYDVLGAARKAVEAYVEMPTGFIARAMEAFRTDTPEGAINVAESRRMKPPYSTMRRRVGKDLMSTVVWYGFQLLMGQAAADFDPEGEGIFIKGLSAAIPMDGLGASAQEQWATLAGVFSRVNLPAVSKMFEEASDSDYWQCRDDYVKGITWLHERGLWPNQEGISLPLFALWFCLRHWSPESRRLSEEFVRDFPDHYRQYLEDSD